MFVIIILNILDCFNISRMYKCIKPGSINRSKYLLLVILLWGTANGLFIHYANMDFFKFVINISVLLFVLFLNNWNKNSLFLTYTMITICIFVIQVFVGIIFSIIIPNNNGDKFKMICQLGTVMLICLIRKLPLNDIYKYIENKLLYQFVFLVICIIIFICLHREFEIINFLDYLPLGIIILVSFINIYKKIFYYTTVYPAIKHDIGNAIASIFIIANKTDDLTIIRKELNHVIAQMGYEISAIANHCSDKVEAFIRTKIKNCNQIEIEYDSKYLEDNIYIPLSDIFNMLGILLDNAMEASPVGNVIKVYLWCDEKNLVIKVDNAINNANELKLDRIFKKGYTTKVHGKGYGLYNLNKITKKYNGHVEIQIKNNRICLSVIIFI